MRFLTNWRRKKLLTKSAVTTNQETIPTISKMLITRPNTLEVYANTTQDMNLDTSRH
jgi:hypothetical protein